MLNTSVSLHQSIRDYIDPDAIALTDSEIDGFVIASRSHDRYAYVRAIARLKAVGRERGDGRLVQISRTLQDLLDTEQLVTQDPAALRNVLWAHEEESKS